MIRLRLTQMPKYLMRLFVGVLAMFILASCVGKVTGTVQSTRNELQLNTNHIVLSVDQTYSFSVLSSGGSPRFSIYTGMGEVTSDGVFTAPPSEGTTMVKVVDENNQVSFITVEIYNKPVLSGPTETVVSRKSMFFVAEGKPPYTFTVSGVNGSAVGALEGSTSKFLAPSSSGKNLITVTDALGASDSVELNIKSNLQFSQSSIDILQGGMSEVLAVSGGVGNYAYKLIGAGTFDLNTLKYTAPSVIATAVLNVTDEAGNSTSLLINTTTGSTLNNLAVTAVRNILSVGEQMQIAVEGGSNLSYQVLSGGGTVSSSGIFTAPNTSGASVVKVTDGQGNSGTISLETRANLSLSLNGSNTSEQNSIEILPDGTINLTIAGGVEPVNVKAGLGTITGTGPYEYKAPEKVGIDIITISDGSGYTQNYYVIINEALRILPKSIHLQKEDRLQFFATGGKEPYSFTVSEGSGNLDSSGLYTAPSSAGTATIKVEDSLGQIANATVTVLESLSVSPFYKVLGSGQVQDFTIAGGSAPYTIVKLAGDGQFCSNIAEPLASSTCNESSLTISEDRFAYKSPTSQSIETIQITDANGKVVTINLQVNGALQIASSTPTLFQGDKALLTISGGVPPFSVTTSSTSIVSVAQKNASAWELVALEPGSVTVSVNDSTGASASTNSITINLGAPTAQLSSLPASLSNSTLLNISVSGANMTHYKFAVIAAGSSTTCLSATYSSAIAVVNPITTDISNLANFPDGLMRVCVIGISATNIEQSPAKASAYSWTKETVGPTAVISGAPTGINLTSTTNITVSGNGATAYKYQVANGNQATDCSGSYSSELSINVPLTAALSGDGNKVVCVLAKGQLEWQTQPTVATWTSDFTGPVLADNVSDGNYSNSSTSSNVITYTPATDDISTVQAHEIRILQDSTVIQDWVAHTQGTAVNGLSLSNGLTYRVEVRAKNQLGLISSVRQSDGWTVDTQGPTLPTSLSLGATPVSLTQTPTLSWTNSTDSVSGVSYYQVQVWSDEATDVLIKDWTNLASGTALSSGITLTAYKSYYFVLRAVDAVGNTSSSVNSATWVAQDADPYWANVETLAHFDGADNSTTFTNQKASTIVTHLGSPVLKTDQSYFGGSSLYLNGSSSIRSNAPNTNWGTQDFTIEAWLYKTTNSVGGNGHVRVFSSQTGAVGEYYAVMKGFNDGTLMFSYNGGCTVIAPFPINVWNHVAVSRNGSTFRLFFNGVQVSTCESSAPLNVNTYSTVGSYWNGGEYWPGYIDDYRVTVGVGRYTSNFEVRLGPFPNQ